MDDVDLAQGEEAILQKVTLSQRRNLGSQSTYRVDFEGVRVSEKDRIGAAGSGWKTWQDVMLDGCVLAAAQAAGGARRALEMTVDYAKTRHQFGKPLGAFQSISHYLADAATQIEGGSTLVYEAAWSRSVGKDVAPFGKEWRTGADEATTLKTDKALKFGSLTVPPGVYTLYTVPNEKVYPFQWNWDSAFVAMGFAVLDIERAWTELETLFLGQWPDGMVPSIVFHKPATNYYPGPSAWGTPVVVIRSVSSVAALPTSNWPHAISASPGSQV